MASLFLAINEDVGTVIFIVALLLIGITCRLIFRKQFMQFKKNHPLLYYSLKRVVAAIFTLFIILTIVFFLLRALPKEELLNSGTMQHLSCEGTDPNQSGPCGVYIRSVYHRYGLDQPIFVQLWTYFKSIIPFPKTICTMYNTALSDLDSFGGPLTDIYGNSIKAGEIYCTKVANGVLIDLGQTQRYSINSSIWGLIIRKAPSSFRYGFPAAMISIVVGIIFGLIMARFKGKAVDTAGLLYINILAAIPQIVFLYVMTMIFKTLRIDYVYSIDNPWLTLGPTIVTMLILSIGGEADYTRRLAVDEMNADYVKFARSKGLSETRIFFTHILRNIAYMLFRSIPAVIIGALLGSFFIESVFRIDGIGRLLIDAITYRDNLLVQNLTLVFALMSVVSSLLSDIFGALIDPRVSLTGNK